MCNKSNQFVLLKIEAEACVTGSAVENADQSFSGNKRNGLELSGVTMVVLHCG